MSFITFYCKNCDTKMHTYVTVNVNHFANHFRRIHKNHEIDIRFEEDLGEKNKTRPMIKYIFYHNVRNPLVGVEIGTKYGDNAYNILTLLNMSMLYLIDPYDNDYEGYDKSDFKEKTVDEAYLIAQDNLKKFNNKKFIRKYSEDAINDIPDNLDFVYVDGNHEYSYVKKDLELYYKKLKPRGVIGGHDFGLYRKDVIKAVIDFIEENNLVEYQSDYTDFWIVKRE